MICEKYKFPGELNIKTHIRLFPDISDRNFWDKARDLFADEFTKALIPFENVERKMLTAGLYREFTVNGNRTNFQAIYYARREELIRRVFIECFYNDGKQMEDILDLTWMILEETSWTLPAHNSTVPEADSLPDFVNNSLDLFLAETACTIVFVYQTVGSKLDEMSTVVNRRIKATLERIIIDDYLNRDDYWWMGFMGGVPNNWNPWINSNVLAVAAAMEDDPEKLRKLTYKAMRSLDNYINPYPEDGACDEGAHYWNQAGLSMLECLWLINSITDGQVDIYSEEKIQNTAEYFMKVYINKGRCINFSDSGSSVPMYFGTIYKFGKILKNEKLTAFAKQLYDERNDYKMAKKEDFDTKSIRVFDYINYSMEMETMPESELQPDTSYYLQSTNIMVSKDTPTAEKGLFLAAKGGHNGESHNHNDVGNFIIYKDGLRFIVDSGNMAYSKITFSDKRYTLWTTRSAYHNVPQINGAEEHEGEEYRPSDVSYSKDEKGEYFSLDIKGAYQNRNDISKWFRSIEFDRKNNQINICEDFEFKSEFPYELHFMTPYKAEKTSDGIILTADNGETLKIQIDMTPFEFSVDTIEIDDKYLSLDWNGKLYRINLKSNAKTGIIRYTVK